MVTVIYGGKGSGKTATLIKEANEAVNVAKGVVVYIDNSASHLREVEYKVRFIDLSEMQISGIEQFCAFLKGMVAGNYDIETVFIDHIERITKHDISQLDSVFAQLTQLTTLLKIKFVITVSAVDDNPPEFLRKYL